MSTNILPLSVWSVVVITQRWWAVLALIALLSTPTIVEDTIGAVCEVPGFPSITSSFIYRLVAFRQRNSVEVNVGTSPASKLDTVQDLLICSFFHKDVTTADLSISDVAFVVETSRMGCQVVLSDSIDRLKDESILLIGDLLELSAETSYHLNL